MMLHMLVKPLILSVKWANVIYNDDDDDKMAADSSMMEQRARAYAWLISDNGVRIIFVSGAKNNNNVTQSDNGICVRGKRHKNTQLIQITLTQSDNVICVRGTTQGRGYGGGGGEWSRVSSLSLS